MASFIPKDIIEQIKEKDNIVICSHTQPDGDAIGSCIGLAYALLSLKKQCAIYNVSSFPRWLEFLNCPVKYINSFTELSFEPELIICLDCATTARLGEEVPSKLSTVLSINIDHHLDNPQYGTYNWTDHNMAATGIMVAELIESLGISFEENMATAIYVALCTDTGNFTFDNTDLLAFEWLCKLAKTPITIPRIQQQLSDNISLSKLKFWAKLYQDIIIVQDGKLAYVKIPLEYFSKFNVSTEDLEGFVETIRQIKDVRVAMLIREETKDKIKISMRSRNNDDVRAILSPLGGGGHKNAAGANLEMSMDDAIAKLLPAISNMW